MTASGIVGERRHASSASGRASSSTMPTCVDMIPNCQPDQVWGPAPKKYGMRAVSAERAPAASGGVHWLR
jgi:hypothetical protein